MLSRFLFIFGLLFVLIMALTFIMTFISDSMDSLFLIISLFGILNGSIAMGISTIIDQTKKG
ncbi:hypothetical protein GCM10008967_04840 [Bacillus carboniphilus]|uniref:Uncharacterized protein n=1 Tax=Bacillus carboniphilus TaxID=86663 RepID=A0ABN0VUD8_9BACI